MSKFSEEFRTLIETLEDDNRFYCYSVGSFKPHKQTNQFYTVYLHFTLPDDSDACVGITGKTPHLAYEGALNNYYDKLKEYKDTVNARVPN